MVLGELSTPSSASTGTIHAIVETGPGSALAESTLTMDIMEELALQVIQQFFTTMKSCIELVLFGSSSFEFTRTLLENPYLPDRGFGAGQSTLAVSGATGNVPEGTEDFGRCQSNE